MEVLELPLLGLFLSGLVRLFRLAAVELCIPVCEPLWIEAALPLLLLVRSVVYQMKRVLLHSSCAGKPAGAVGYTGYCYAESVSVYLLVVEEVKHSNALTLVTTSSACKVGLRY